MKDLVQCLWTANVDGEFRPSIRDVLGFFTHPFPSRDGNRRSFITTADLKRIPQNGAAPFRMESRTLLEINWSHVTSDAVVAFVGEF